MAPQSAINADICIVGAGIAGLNAAFVASQYLGKNGKIVLVDRRPRVGGMWVDTYDYVRLHQPHPFFTAGNIKWTLGRDRSYLATKGEVLDHFQHCVDVIAKRVEVELRCGWDYLSHTESDGLVRVQCRSSDGSALTITAKKLITAYGLSIQANPPLSVSSSRVRSVTPNECDVRSGEISPFWHRG